MTQVLVILQSDAVAVMVYCFHPLKAVVESSPWVALSKSSEYKVVWAKVENVRIVENTVKRIPLRKCRCESGKSFFTSKRA